jgi:F-type H+-transporting ATPase subunit b
MDLFKLDPGLAIWTWIIFGVLFFLLWKYALPPLIRSIRDREERIALSVDKAARIERRLAEIEQEHAEMTRKARAEADDVLRRTRQEAETVRERLLQKAEKDAQEILQRVHGEIAEERAAAVEGLRQEVAGLVLEAAEQLVGRSFDSREDRKRAEELAETL